MISKNEDNQLIEIEVIEDINLQYCNNYENAEQET